jgi:hypothetical protein
MDLDDAFNSTQVEKEYKRTCAHIECVREHWDEVTEIKGYLANDELEMAWGVFGALPQPVQIGLYRASTKGGVWTMDERRKLDARKLAVSAGGSDE